MAYIYHGRKQYARLTRMRTMEAAWTNARAWPCVEALGYMQLAAQCTSASGAEARISQNSHTVLQHIYSDLYISFTRIGAGRDGGKTIGGVPRSLK